MIAGQSAQALVLAQLLAIGLVVVLTYVCLPRTRWTLGAFLLVAMSGILGLWTTIATMLWSENLLLLLFALLLLAIARRGEWGLGRVVLIGVIVGPA
jgi:hypothetical protein